MSTIKDLKGQATGLWAKYKYYIIAGVAVLVFLIIICCCICRCKKMRKKKKKEAEKLKLKGAKPGKKLRRIQPGKNEIKVMEELGTLKFILKYDSTSQMLVITVREAADVPVRDLSGYAYSYVVAKCLPLYEHMTEDYRTKEVRAGFWPTFNDNIEFQVKLEELGKQTLYLYLFEMNRWTKKEGIGQVALLLDSLGLHLGKEHVIERKLKPYDPLIGLEVETGAVRLRVEYDDEWNLTVEVIEADIIPQDESKEKEGSYVTVSALNKDGETLKKLRTKVKQGTLHPDFGDQLLFSIPENIMPDLSLKINLKAKRKLKKNQLLGSFIIRSDSEHWKKLLEDNEILSWFSVFRKPKI